MTITVKVIRKVTGNSTVIYDGKTKTEIPPKTEADRRTLRHKTALRKVAKLSSTSARKATKRVNNYNTEPGSSFLPEGAPMKALSIKQPYAGLIIAGIKNIENRSWTTKFRGTLAIASTKSPDTAEWWNPMRKKCAKLGVEFPEELCKVNGAILGTVTFNNICWMSEDGTPEPDSLTFNGSDWWNEEMIGFILENPRKLLKPIPIKGALGLYNLADDVVQDIQKQLSSL